jgi:hypothetical protein
VTEAALPSVCEHLVDPPQVAGECRMEVPEQPPFTVVPQSRKFVRRKKIKKYKIK